METSESRKTVRLSKLDTLELHILVAKVVATQKREI